MTGTRRGTRSRASGYGTRRCDTCRRSEGKARGAPGVRWVAFASDAGSRRAAPEGDRMVSRFHDATIADMVRADKRYPLGLSVEVNTFHEGWLTRHIQGKDRAYARSLGAHGAI